MLLMTVHGHLVGLDQGTLIQVAHGEECVATLFEVSVSRGNLTFESGPLAGFTLIQTPHGVNFAKGGKFLCAEPGKRNLVADRKASGVWETFQLLTHENVIAAAEVFAPLPHQIERLRRKVNDLVELRQPVKLQFGCGPGPIAGYLNFDIVVAAPAFAFTHPDEYFIFPFADNSWGIPDDCIDYIFHEDFIEHIDQLKQIQFMAEARRVLKHGSYHRVNTPNLLAAMKRHSDFSLGSRGVYTGEMQWGHVSIFSPDSLKEMAELVGYREVIFTTKNHGVSPFAGPDNRPWGDRDAITGNIYADLQK